MTFFQGKENSIISAVIYSRGNVLNNVGDLRNQKLENDCTVVHNPNATNKLPRTTFDSFDQWVDNGEGQIELIRAR